MSVFFNLNWLSFAKAQTMAEEDDEGTILETWFRLTGSRMTMEQINAMDEGTRDELITRKRRDEEKELEQMRRAREEDYEVRRLTKEEIMPQLYRIMNNFKTVRDNILRDRERNNSRERPERDDVEVTTQFAEMKLDSDEEQEGDQGEWDEIQYDLVTRIEAALRDYVLRLAPPEEEAATNEYMRIIAKHKGYRWDMPMPKGRTKRDRDYMRDRRKRITILDYERRRILREAEDALTADRYWYRCLKEYGLDEDPMLWDERLWLSPSFGGTEVEEVPTREGAEERLQERVKEREEEWRQQTYINHRIIEHKREQLYGDNVGWMNAEGGRDTMMTRLEGWDCLWNRDAVKPYDTMTTYNLKDHYRNARIQNKARNREQTLRKKLKELIGGIRKYRGLIAKSEGIPKKKRQQQLEVMKQELRVMEHLVQGAARWTRTCEHVRQFNEKTEVETPTKGPLVLPTKPKYDGTISRDQAYRMIWLAMDGQDWKGPLGKRWAGRRIREKMAEERFRERLRAFEQCYQGIRDEMIWRPTREERKEMMELL